MSERIFSLTFKKNVSQLPKMDCWGGPLNNKNKINALCKCFPRKCAFYLNGNRENNTERRKISEAKAGGPFGGFYRFLKLSLCLVSFNRVDPLCELPLKCGRRLQLSPALPFHALKFKEAAVHGFKARAGPARGLGNKCGRSSLHGLWCVFAGIISFVLSLANWWDRCDITE